MGWPGLDRPGRRFLLLLLLMGAELLVGTGVICTPGLLGFWASGLTLSAGFEIPDRRLSAAQQPS